MAEVIETSGPVDVPVFRGRKLILGGLVAAVVGFILLAIGLF